MPTSENTDLRPASDVKTRIGLHILVTNRSAFHFISFHLTSSGLTVLPFFTASRIGRGGPFLGTVTSTHNSSPGCRRDGSTACSGKKKPTGSLRAATKSPLRVLHRVTLSPVGLGAGLATRRPFSACK